MTGHRYVISLVIGLLSVVLPAASSSAAGTVQTFYVPLPEAEIRASFLELQNGNGGLISSTLRSVISITAPRSGTILYYDHWENGFDADIANPANVYSGSNPGGTQIWGDNDPANGMPPGFVTDVINAGDVIALDNDVDLPRSASVIRFDGRDKFAVTEPVAVSRAEWAVPQPGTVLAGAVETYPVTDFGTYYEMPIGEDVNVNRAWEYTAMFIMASSDGTSVNVDSDGNGSTDVTQVLGEGESLFINGGIMKGATVTASAPVQVHLVTGDRRSTSSSESGAYEARFYTQIARSRWGRDYYNPVGSVSSPNQPTRIILYNPNSAAITVNYETVSESGGINVPAKDTAEYVMPANSGANFVSTSDFFATAIAAAGPNNGGSSSVDNDTWDWGFTLVPTENLTSILAVGWGPGSGNLSKNSSPVWVAVANDTTVYVDYDGNPATGPNTDPAGDRYDVALNMIRLQQTKIFDNSDNDQTGIKLYTLDGTPITAAWGPDPATAGPGNPDLDIGTTVPPFPVPRISLVSTDLSDGDGDFEPNDTVGYTLSIENMSSITLSGLVLSDILGPGLTYIPGTMTLNGTPYADDAAPATLFPLDAGGITLGALPAGASTIITFEVTIASGASGTLTNTAILDAPLGTTQVTDTIIITPPSSAPCSLQFTNAAFSPVGSYAEGDTVYINLQDADLNTDAATAQTFLMTVTNLDNGDIETVLLMENGVNASDFRNTGLASSPSSGFAAQDGTLLFAEGETIRIAYTDPLFPTESCSDQVSIAVTPPPTLTKQLYLTGSGGAALDGLDRIDPVATGDGTTASSFLLNGRGPVTIDARDDLNPSGSYSEQDGTTNWSTNWIEIGDDGSPSGGTITITLNRLYLRPSSTSASVYRGIDFTGIATADLAYNIRRDSGAGTFRVQVSTDLSTWTTIRTHTGGGTTGDPAFVDSLDSFLPHSGKLYIRFLRESGSSSGGQSFDNIAVTGSGGGSTISDDFDGAENGWTAPWSLSADASVGAELECISGACLEVRARNNSLATRAFSLNGVTKANLTYTVNDDVTSGSVVVELLDGSNTHVLKTYDKGSGTGLVNESFDLHTLIGAGNFTSTMTLRFRHSSGDDSNRIHVDNIKITLGGSGSTATFTQTPAMAETFSMPTGSTVRVVTYVDVTDGSLTGVPDVEAVLKHGATVFATLTAPIFDSGAGTLTWAGTLPANISVPPGESIIPN